MAERWPIVVPRDTVNDDFVILLKWLIADGERVEQGAVVAAIETSKAVVELEAQHAGFVLHGAKVQEQVAVGAPLGDIVSELGAAAAPPAAAALAAAGPSTATVPATAQTLSKRARELIEEHHLDPALFAGKALVREQDVLAVLAAAPAPAQRAPRAGIAETVPLSSVKRTEIRYLTAGNEHALLSAVTVLVDASALDRRIEARAAERRLGYLEFVIASAARNIRDHRELNAVLTGERGDAIGYYQDVNVGVAVNLGRGLVVPVIHHADQRTAEEISVELSTVSMKYLRQELVEADVIGGTFTVTDLSGAGAYQVLPLINREQTAILAIGRDAGGPSVRLALTLAFDHRASDGQQAADFLRAVKEELEEGVVVEASPRATSNAPATLACGNCYVTLERLRENGIGSFLIPVIRSDGSPSYTCNVCLAGWNG